MGNHAFWGMTPCRLVTTCQSTRRHAPQRLDSINNVVKASHLAILRRKPEQCVGQLDSIIIIIIINNTFLIDIAVPNTHDLAKKITDKENKHQELANEICAMWKQRTAQVIPIVIPATGVIPKSLSQSLTRLNLHPNTYIQLQKSVTLGTCLIVRNFLNYKLDHRA